MPASKANYLVLWKDEPQVFAAASKGVALESPHPSGADVDLSNKRVFFVTYQPDNEIVSVHELPREEVLNAELRKTAKGRPTKDQI